MSSSIVLPKDGELWLPNLGVVPMHIRAAEKAVSEYDSDLLLARQNETDDWVVLIRNGPEGRPFPVFNLGKELPPPEQIKKKLYMSDVRRRGPEIVNEIQRQHETRRQLSRDEAHDAAGEVAEAIEMAMRKEGKTNHTRVYVSGGKK